jgi:hypothetical protein
MAHIPLICIKKGFKEIIYQKEKGISSKTMSFFCLKPNEEGKYFRETLVRVEMRWCKIPLHSLFYLRKYIEKLLIKLEIVLWSK